MSYAAAQVTGELWLRSPEGFKTTANTLLSSIYLKYSTAYPTFYAELTSNQISRFDVFYDSIFIETPSGSIIEKFYVEEDLILPFTLTNQYSLKIDPQPGFLVYNTYMDYWFAEKENKVYFTQILGLEENKNFTDIFSFAFLVNEFDCKSGELITILYDKITLSYNGSANWDIYNYVLESPKITYNDDTNLFNVSFLLKNASRQFGMVSINLGKGNTAERGHLAVTEVNGHLPFFNLNAELCEVIPYDPLVGSKYRILTVATDPGDPAYGPKYLVATIQDLDNSYIDKYLILN